MDNNEVNNSSPVEEVTTPPKRKFNNTVLIGMLVVIVAVICCAIVLWPRGNKEHVDSTTTVKKTNTTTTTAVGEPSSEEDDNDLGEEEDEDDDACETELINTKNYELKAICNEADEHDIVYLKIHGVDVTNKLHQDQYYDIEEYDDFLVVNWSYDNTCGYGQDHVDIFNYKGELLFDNDKETHDSKQEDRIRPLYNNVEYDSKTKTVKVKYVNIISMDSCDEKEAEELLSSSTLDYKDVELESNETLQDYYSSDWSMDLFCEQLKDKKIPVSYTRTFTIQNNKFTNEKLKNNTYINDNKKVIDFCKNVYNITIKK